MQEKTEAKRLEALLSGELGVQYTNRNSQTLPGAGEFHYSLCRRLDVRRVLKVGCNVGLNLTRITADPGLKAWGIDLNWHAISNARERLPGASFSLASAYHLPFRDKAFDLTFTSGVLIHIAPQLVSQVINEIHRTGARWIACGEYYSEQLTEVPYRGERGALHKLDFGRLFLERFPSLKLVDKGFLAKETTGFDNLTFWLFEKG